MHELTGIAFSHYVEKARWALDRFGVPYRDRRVLPLFHFWATYRVHRGKLGRRDLASTRFSTPVLRTDDGRVLCDSAEIVRYVSHRFAPLSAELYGSAEVEKLEQHFHDQLGPYSRLMIYGTLFQQPALLRRIVRNNVSRVPALAFMACYPLARAILVQALGVRKRQVVQAIDRVRRELDLVSERLQDGRPFLLGDRFTAADLAFACLAAPAVFPPEYSAWMPPLSEFASDARARTLEFRSTPAGAFALRMFAEERRRVVSASGQASSAVVPGHAAVAANA